MVDEGLFLRARPVLPRPLVSNLVQSGSSPEGELRPAIHDFRARLLGYFPAAEVPYGGILKLPSGSLRPARCTSFSSGTLNVFMTRAGSVPCWSSPDKCVTNSMSFSMARKMKILVVEGEISQQERPMRSLSDAVNKVTTS